MMKNFKITDKVKVIATGKIYGISYFLRNNREYREYQKNDIIMIKGVGKFTEDELEIIPREEYNKQIILENYNELDFSFDEKLELLNIIVDDLNNNGYFISCNRHIDLETLSKDEASSFETNS